MDIPVLNTERLILRPFEERDLQDLLLLLWDEEVNTFLPWFPARTLEEAHAFYVQRFSGPRPYAYAICLRTDNRPIGYVKASTDEARDFGYALRKDFWHQGIATEAGRALIELLRQDGAPYITATHDVKNPRSGGVMQNLGMTYRYTYREQWQPKDFPVFFRMYQLNLDGREERVYRAYWDHSEVHFVEENP